MRRRQNATPPAPNGSDTRWYCPLICGTRRFGVWTRRICFSADSVIRPCLYANHYRHSFFVRTVIVWNHLEDAASSEAFCERLRPNPTRRTSWKPGLATSFQLVRLVGCGLYLRTVSPARSRAAALSLTRCVNPLTPAVATWVQLDRVKL